MWLLVWAARRLDASRPHAKAGSIARGRSGADGGSADGDTARPTRTCWPRPGPATRPGDYGMAIIYAYAYQLVELDQHHAIQLRKGKTNRQYLRELRRSRGCRSCSATRCSLSRTSSSDTIVVPAAVRALLGQSGRVPSAAGATGMRTRGHDMRPTRCASRVASRIEQPRTAVVAPARRGVLSWLARRLLADSQDLEVTYGQRRGTAGGSVNGTSVLAGMFDEAGFQVSRGRTLATSCSRYDVIVWAPDDFRPPEAEVRSSSSSGCVSQSARRWCTSAATTTRHRIYWEAVLAAAPADRAARIHAAARLGQRRNTTRGRLDMPAEADHRVVHRRDGIEPRPQGDAARRTAGVDGHGRRRSAISAPRACSRFPRDEELTKFWPDDETLRCFSSRVSQRC